MPVLLLTTTGRRSGRPHRVGLTYLPYRTGYAVIGSNAGARMHPDWVLNLRAHPTADVEIRGRHASVQTREAGGGERTELWRRAVAAYSGYAGYQRRTSRRIPVVVMEPMKSEGSERNAE